MTQPPGKPPASRARGIDRLITLCEQLHLHRQPMTPRELIKATGAPRSSVYELVNLLCEAGWLEVDDDGRIFFGRAMHYFGLDYADHNDLIRRARPVMRQLSARFDETTQLCMLDGDKYTVMLNENGARPFRISSEVGVKVPIPWTASGRVLLGGMGREAVLSLVPEADFVLPSGERIDVDGFITEVERARERGFALTEGLVDSFACCMAVPIHDADGPPRATLCFTVGRNADATRRETLIAALREAAQGLSAGD
ncbi:MULTISPECIES: IclR family transcriptional regulator [unclassified Modicisalibacter]|uniref:IclR family transcriptional regulator n=1 Tax=unclassified Modicisalibacter TaxID=2679913 RepID=UPI001CC93482|nr:MULTISPECIES: IclR family transcriptional regulator [unclassified Modicisalibacter]MBZ9558467.1 IclR family transcriptional regulator [Modicisalibacter sp. R2A 31.J]MBZ9575641.1 IclR family transcriptional regulator [Modicisalibacter sp. MOD 31.J]